MIVVEGPPGSGSHNLTKKLVRDLGVPLGGPVSSHSRETLYMVLGWVVTGDQPVRVREGFFFKEVLEASLRGRRPQFTEGEVIYVRKILTALECPVIVCLPPWERVLDGLTVTQAKEIPEAQLEGLYLVYTNLILNSPGPTLTSEHVESQPTDPSKILWYDHTGEQDWTIPYTYILERCRDYITKRAERTW